MAIIDELIERLRQGEVEALGAFVAARRNRLLAFIDGGIRLAFHRKIDAGEIFRETVLTATESFPRVDLKSRDPFEWLCDLAEKHLRESVRKLRRAKVSKKAHLTQQNTTNPTDMAMQDDRPIRFQAALAKLSEADRRLIHMRYDRRMSSRQMAKTLGQNASEVRHALLVALSALREHFGQDIPPELLKQ